MEYIIRKAAIKAVDDLPNCYNGFSDTYDKACIIGVLEELPAADVVAVVRCRDCVHGEHYYDGVSCRMPSFPEWKVHEKDYFCADGARMDGDGE